MLLHDVARVDRATIQSPPSDEETLLLSGVWSSETATADQPLPDAEEPDGAAAVKASTNIAPHAYVARMRNIGDRPSGCRDFDRTADR